MAAAPEQAGRELLQCAFGVKKKEREPKNQKSGQKKKVLKPQEKEGPLLRRLPNKVGPDQKWDRSKIELIQLANDCSMDFMKKIFEGLFDFSIAGKAFWEKNWVNDLYNPTNFLHKSTLEMIEKSMPTMQQSMWPFVKKYVDPKRFSDEVQIAFEEIVYTNKIMEKNSVLYPVNSIFAPLVFFVLTPKEYSQDEGMYGMENPSFKIGKMEMKLDIRFMTQLRNSQGYVSSEPFQKNDLLKIWWQKAKPFLGLEGLDYNGHLTATLEGERFPNAVGSFGFGVDQKEQRWWLPSSDEKELKWWSIDQAFSIPMDKLYVKVEHNDIETKFKQFQSRFSLRANAPLTAQEAHNLSWFSYSVLNAHREKIMLLKDNPDALITALQKVFTVPKTDDGEPNGYFPHSYVDYPVPNTAYGLFRCIVDPQMRFYSDYYQNCLGGLQSLFPTVFSCGWAYDNLRHFSQCHALKGRNTFCK